MDKNYPIIPEYARDCYQIAEERGISVKQAVKEMKNEGWEFWGYNDCGEYVYTPPKKKEIKN